MLARLTAWLATTPDWLLPAIYWWTLSGEGNAAVAVVAVVIVPLTFFKRSVWG